MPSSAPQDCGLGGQQGITYLVLFQTRVVWLSGWVTRYSDKGVEGLPVGVEHGRFSSGLRVRRRRGRQGVGRCRILRRAKQET
jgi:hypothetical protein